MFDPGRFPRIDTLRVTALPGQTVTASATPHTKGSWTSIVTVAPFDIYFLNVFLGNVAASTSVTSMLVDIGIDPAGGTSYTVIIPNILCSGAAPNTIGGQSHMFPVFIPKGSQIAARCQAIVVSDTVTVGCTMIGGHNRTNPWPHRGAIQDYGTNLTDSGGTPLANAGANSKGAWVQLGADTTRRHSGLIYAAGGNVSTMSAATLLIDIGVDPAGGTSYGVVIPNLFLRHSNTEQVYLSNYLTGLLAIDIPAGAAIGVRSQCSATNDNDRTDVAVYAF